MSESDSKDHLFQGGLFLDRVQAQRMVTDRRRLSSLRQTIKRWNTKAQAKGYDNVLQAIEAAPQKE